jgi:hypothetical protein
VILQLLFQHFCCLPWLFWNFLQTYLHYVSYKYHNNSSCSHFIHLTSNCQENQYIISEPIQYFLLQMQEQIDLCFPGVTCIVL